MYSYDTTELLVFGYIRSNHNDFLKELSRICMNYYWLRLPKFTLNHDHTNNFNLDYMNAKINCSIPPTLCPDDEDPDDSLWSDDTEKCIHGRSTVLWQNYEAIKAPKHENVDNLFKFEMKSTHNFNSFGVGIVSQNSNIKYLLWIQARYHHNTEKKCDSYLKFTKETIYNMSRETNHETIQLYESGHSLSVILNYDKDVAEFYYNNDRIICINIGDTDYEVNTDDKSFYPIFCFIPNVCSNINDIPFKTSTFEIISCHLCRMSKNRMFNESMVTIQRYNDLLLYSILPTEPDQYNDIALNNWSNVKDIFFDLLWKGYNFLNLEQFDNKLSNVIHKLRDIKIGQNEEEKKEDCWHRKRHESLMINLWILIEMFQPFRKQYIELIYDVISNKVNNSNYNSISLIITDYILQNFDTDYQDCFVSDHDYLKRLSKIYMDPGFVYSGDPKTKWFDENVLPKLSFIPKEVWITHSCSLYCHYYWKYYYHTKETIVYKPGVLYDGEDYHHPDQTDWQYNQLMISHDLSQLLVTGYISELFNDQHTYKHLPISITINCLNYYFLCIPNFSHKKVRYPNNYYDDQDIDCICNGYRPKEEECKEEIKIHIDYKDGIVTYKHDEKEIDNFYKWANNIFEGIWKQIRCKEFNKEYVHRFEMQSIQNFYSFAIGITTFGEDLEPYYKTYCICIEQQEKNAKLSVNAIKLTWYSINDETDIEEEIKTMEINKGKVGDKLSLILDYHKSQVAFYYNNDKFVSVDLEQYLEVFTNDDEDDYIAYKCFYHPIFSFKTNDFNADKVACSKYKILSCHLETDQNN